MSTLREQYERYWRFRIFWDPFHHVWAAQGLRAHTQTGWEPIAGSHDFHALLRFITYGADRVREKWIFHAAV